MSISYKDTKLLWGRAVERCAICRKQLSHDDKNNNKSFPIGEQAHIVSEEPDGPRGSSSLNRSERNSYHNLILLCPTHHTIIDKDVNKYPIECLHMLKSKHELWAHQTLERDLAREREDLIDLSEFLTFIELIRPILYWLYRPIPQEQAQSFFLKLNRFWMYDKIAAEDVDQILMRGLDLLIRPLASGIQVLFDDEHYAVSKLHGSFNFFAEYSEQKGIEVVKPERKDTPIDIVRLLSMHIEIVLRTLNTLPGAEVEVLRHVLHISKYYEEYISRDGLVEIPETLVNQFLSIVERYFNSRLGVRFPDVLDVSALDRIKNISRGSLFSN